jgi:hypothetical protein
VGEDVIDVDTQNLGMRLRELREVVLEGDEFIPSTARPVERVERQDDVLLAAILRQGDRLVTRRPQREIGCFGTDLGHLLLHLASS